MSEIQKLSVIEQTPYPTELVEKVHELPQSVGQSELNSKSLYVVQGLDKSLAEQLVQLSTQPDILHNCPNDAAKRFSNIQAVQKWMEKGRLALPLVRKSSDGTMKLVGFGWMGPGEPGNDEPTINGAKTTFAIRIYDEAKGQGIAKPYTKAILDAHEVLYGNTGVWLETWEDNTAAVKTYENSGFEKVAEISGDRHRVYMTLGRIATADLAK